MVSSICLIVAAAILASVAGLRQDGTWEQPSSQSTDIPSTDSTERDPEGTLSLRIASLPQPADIDAGDASAAESAYRQIADIYDLVQTYELTLTPEQESAISQVIAAYYPAEEIAGMKSLPAGGGVLQSGSYALRSDLSLQELDLTIPAGAEVTIELNGYTLTGTGEGSVITVESGGTLTVQDSSFYPYFRTGTITGGTGSEPKEESTGSAWTQFTVGGGIYVLGTLHMSGGTILDCTANAGGGVYIYAKAAPSASFTIPVIICTHK